MTKSARPRRGKENRSTATQAPQLLMKDALPPAWAESRAAIEKKYGLGVRKWYFFLLIALAIALFTASFVFNSLGMALIAALLAIMLSQWNKRARKASASMGTRRQ